MHTEALAFNIGVVYHSPLSSVKKISSAEEIKSLAVFQYATQEEADRISKETSNSNVRTCIEWVREGHWIELVHWLAERNENYFTLLAAHALGEISSLELATAFMFSGCNLDAKKVEIYPLDPASFLSQKIGDEYQVEASYLKSRVASNQLCGIAITPKEGITLNIGDLQYARLAFYRKGILYIPSIEIIQALFCLRFGEAAHTIYPVLHLSKRRDMIEHFRRNVSDLALLLPDDKTKLHGSVERGIYPIAHDLSHLYHRSIIAMNHLVSEYMDVAALMEDCLEKIPENADVICDDYTFLFPHKSSSDENLVRWLLNEAGGQLVDGDFILKSGFSLEMECSLKSYLKETLENRIFLLGNIDTLFDFSSIDQELLVEKCWAKINDEINFMKLMKAGKLINI